jgi:cell division protein FtsI (penicillin-binding protein 3)
LLVSVIVDQPQGDIYGGSVAAPAFGKIAAFALPYLGAPAE